jgi:hypothetical protein
MKRILALLMAGLLSACATPDMELGQHQPDVVASGAVCRIGPEGGPIIADRGIGGTGTPQMTQTATEIAEKGIGGTGIVGVITGFASVCVDGLEVHYDATAAVDIDGTATSASALRVGHVVVIKADGSSAAPQARTISVRNELAGRIESVELGSGTLTIAGQAVSVPAGTWGADRFGLGDWVTVSGLRREDGIVVASRMDPAAVGTLAARGQVVQEGGVIRVGGVVLQAAIAGNVKPGQFVTVSGVYVAGKGQVNTVVADTLFANPAAYFGHSVNRIMVQAFVRVANGAVSLNGVQVKAGPGVSAQAGAGRPSIVSLERRPDGSFTAIGLRAADLRGQANGASQGRAHGGAGYVTSTPVSSRRASGSGQPDDAPAGSGTGGQTASTTTDTDAASGAGGNATAPAAASTAAAVPSIATTPVAIPMVAVPGSVSPAPVSTVTTPAAVQNLSVNSTAVTAAVAVKSAMISPSEAKQTVSGASLVTSNVSASATKVSDVAKVTGSVSHPSVSVVTGAVSPVTAKAGGATPIQPAGSTAKKTTTIGTTSSKSTSGSAPKQSGH